MNSWFLYLLLKLDAVGGIFIGCGFAGISAIIVFLSILGAIVNDREEWWKIAKRFRSQLVVVLSFISIFIGCLIPSTKQMAVIYVVPKVMESDIIQKIPKQILQLSEEWLEELRPKKETE